MSAFNLSLDSQPTGFETQPVVFGTKSAPFLLVAPRGIRPLRIRCGRKPPSPTMRNCNLHDRLV